MITIHTCNNCLCNVSSFSKTLFSTLIQGVVHIRKLENSCLQKLCTLQRHSLCVLIVLTFCYANHFTLWKYARYELRKMKNNAPKCDIVPTIIPTTQRDFLILRFESLSYADYCWVFNITLFWAQLHPSWMELGP